jgi:hypothetical protein
MRAEQRCLGRWWGPSHSSSHTRNAGAREWEVVRRGALKLLGVLGWGRVVSRGQAVADSCHLIQPHLRASVSSPITWGPWSSLEACMAGEKNEAKYGKGLMLCLARGGGTHWEDLPLPTP